LSQGENTLTFNLTNGTGRNGVMWDCIKLETGDMTTSDIGQNSIASPKVIAIEYYNLQGIRMCQAPKGLCIVSTITEDGRRENKIVNYK
jgi:rhamnogalacturonan endolyase